MDGTCWSKSYDENKAALKYGLDMAKPGSDRTEVVRRGNLFEMADLARPLLTENAALRERVKALEIENRRLAKAAYPLSRYEYNPITEEFTLKTEPLPQSECDRMWDELRMAAQS